MNDCKFIDQNAFKKTLYKYALQQTAMYVGGWKKEASANMNVQE